MNKSKVQRALKRAKSLIVRGWLQGRARDRKNGVWHFCTSEAILVACRPESSSVYDDAYHLLSSCVPSNFERSIISYNDAPTRTKEQVLGLFDRAIAKVSR